MSCCFGYEASRNPPDSDGNHESQARKILILNAENGTILPQSHFALEFQTQVAGCAAKHQPQDSAILSRSAQHAGHFLSLGSGDFFKRGSFTTAMRRFASLSASYTHTLFENR